VRQSRRTFSNAARTSKAVEIKGFSPFCGPQRERRETGPNGFKTPPFPAFKTPFEAGFKSPVFLRYFVHVR
jgi:hypothetical protein